MRHLVTTTLAILAAVVIAVGFFGVWWMSPVPTFIIFTPVLHGLVLGAALAGLFDAMGIRSRAQRVAVGILAGAVSVASLLGWQYTLDASSYRTRHAMAVEILAMERGVTVEPREDRFVLYDRELLVPRTGHRGIVGYLRLRYQPGTWRCYVYGLEVALVVVLAAALPVVVRREATVD